MIETLTPAVDKSMRIFELLARQPGATFSQIQQGTALPKSTTSSLLASLAAHGLVRNERGRYSLGLRWYEYGSKVEQELDIKQIALEPLTRLRDATELTCHLGVLEGTAAIYVLKLESPSAIIIRSWVGRRLSLHSSGLGKVLVAWLPDVERERLLPEIDFVARTRRTITDAEAFRRELAATRSRGWAFDDAEDHDGVYCIAAPILDRDGRAVAAISASGVAVQMAHEAIPDLSARVVATAAAISAAYERHHR